MLDDDHDVRAIWLDSGTIVAINQALIDADQRGVNERALTWNLGAIVSAWDAAPINPAEAITKVLAVLDGYPTNWRDEADIPDALRRDALAVLRALGVSSPHAANTDTTNPVE